MARHKFYSILLLNYHNHIKQSVTEDINHCDQTKFSESRHIPKMILLRCLRCASLNMDVRLNLTGGEEVR